MTARLVCNHPVPWRDDRLGEVVGTALCLLDAGHDGEHSPIDHGGCVTAVVPLGLGHP